MRKLQLHWSEYYKYNVDNVAEYASTKAGVYKISFLQKDNNLKVRYVGQTNNINRRLNEHLNLDNEKNTDLKDRLAKYSAYFSFAEVDSQDDRDGVELALYKYYEPTCNDSDAIPSGPIVEINYKNG